MYGITKQLFEIWLQSLPTNVSLNILLILTFECVKCSSYHLSFPPTLIIIAISSLLNILVLYLVSLLFQTGINFSLMSHLALGLCSRPGKTALIMLIQSSSGLSWRQRRKMKASASVRV